MTTNLSAVNENEEQETNQPDGLAEATFMLEDTIEQKDFTEMSRYVSELRGKTIANAELRETHVEVTTTDGMYFEFFGIVDAKRSGEASMREQFEEKKRLDNQPYDD